MVYRELVGAGELRLVSSDYIHLAVIIASLEYVPTGCPILFSRSVLGIFFLNYVRVTNLLGSQNNTLFDVVCKEIFAYL